MPVLLNDLIINPNTPIGANLIMKFVINVIISNNSFNIGKSNDERSNLSNNIYAKLPA